MHQSLSFGKSLLVAVLLTWGCVLGSTVRGDDAPSPPATVADTPAKVALPVEANNTPDVPVILRVSRFVGEEKKLDVDPHRCTARRGDDLYVHAQQLEQWIGEVKNKVQDGKTEVLDLVLYLNGFPLHGVHPNHFFVYEEQLSAFPVTGGPSQVTKRPVHYLRFTLECTPESTGAWQRLLRRPNFDPRTLEVSVGFENGSAMQTYVTSDKRQQFYFIALPPLRFWLGVGIIFASLVLFLALAQRTDIISDTSAPLRPDGQRPYSLARAQMAFWFFLVLAAFFFLWVLTGTTDTLNTSVLALIGISAATALGSAFVDGASNDEHKEDAGHHLAAVDLSRPRHVIRRQIKEMIAAAENQLVALEAERATIPKEDETRLDSNGLAIKEAQANVETLKQQLDYFQWPAWKGVLYDLLAEKGFISFHRFQILVWTVVLGSMFVISVYTETTMPEFSATLLGLLGISGGTYVGFKLPASQKQAD